MRCRVAECGKFGNAQHSKFSLAGVCGRSRQSENGVFLGGDISFSFVACAFWYAFALNLKGHFYSFYHIFVLSYRIFSFYRSFLIFSLIKLIFWGIVFLLFFKYLVFELFAPFFTRNSFCHCVFLIICCLCFVWILCYTKFKIFSFIQSQYDKK